MKVAINKDFAKQVKAAIRKRNTRSLLAVIFVPIFTFYKERMIL